MIALPRAVGKAMTAQVIRASELKEQRLKPYRQAIEVFNGRRQWPTSHEETLMEGNFLGCPARLYLRNCGGLVALYLIRFGEKTNYVSSGFRVGLLGGNGWELSNEATEDIYMQWRTKIEKDIHKAVKK